MKMYMQNQYGAFTLVELIVVIAILSILGTIGYVSLLGYQVIARDTVRISDINTITKAVELYKLEQGNFPIVSDSVDITFSGSSIWRQGTFGKESYVQVRRISEIPTDPLTGTEYAYSVTYATSEYQVGAVVERASSLSQSDTSLFAGILQASAAQSILPSFATSKINGNYNGVFIAHRVIVSPTQTDIYILGVPTILASDIADTDLSSLVAGSRFAAEGKGNAPASYSGAVTTESPWSYAPVAQNDTNNGNTPFPTGVIYKTTLEELNTKAEKILAFTAIQNYYQGSGISQSDTLRKINSIDPLTQPNAAIDAINQMINLNIGGLGNMDIVVNQVDVSADVGSTGGGPATPGDPSDPSCVFNQESFGGCNFG